MSTATRRTVASGVDRERPRHVVGCRRAARVAAQAAKAPQKIDAEYTAKIKEVLQDARITTELVDHLPASDTVPTPLKFHGRIVGQPGELTYSKDINRYLEAIDKASDRAMMWTIGKSEEGRDIVMMAIRRRGDDQAALEIQGDARAAHRPAEDDRGAGAAAAEDGQADLLRHERDALAGNRRSRDAPGARLPARRRGDAVHPADSQQRHHLHHAGVEVDGREKQVDTYYYGKKTGKQRPPLMYWGKYVAHDNNRDGMGQLLELTRSVNRVQLEWKPTIMHDLHEAQTYLYASTGTGPTTNSSIPSPLTSGGSSRRTT
jgi:hypothetical protein